eukprot:Pgem_evm1s14358
MVTSSASFTEYPEAVENKLYESVNARKNSLKKEGGLGPPDLCHLTKQQEKPPSILRSAPQLPSVIGTYHHVFGMDCRTPAGVAAYFTNTVNNQQTKVIFCFFSIFLHIQRIERPIREFTPPPPIHVHLSSCTYNGFLRFCK